MLGRDDRAALGRAFTRLYLDSATTRSPAPLHAPRLCDVYGQFHSLTLRWCSAAACSQRSALLALNIFHKLCTYIACLSVPSPHACCVLECTRIPSNFREARPDQTYTPYTHPGRGQTVCAPLLTLHALALTRAPSYTPGHHHLMQQGGNRGVLKPHAPAHPTSGQRIAALLAPTSTCIRPGTLAWSAARSAKTALPRYAETSTPEPGNSQHNHSHSRAAAGISTAVSQ